MSNLKIEELFTVDASVETVWKFLLDPAEVATCLPGAKLDGLVEGESDTYRGTMKVKVGPVVSEFRGKATLSDVNEAKHSLKISGTGDDKGGGGSARMTMTCRVQPALDAPEGATQCEVAVIAEVELAGKLVEAVRDLRLVGLAVEVLQRLLEERLLGEVGELVEEGPRLVAIAVREVLADEAALLPQGRERLFHGGHLQRRLELGEVGDVKEALDAADDLGQRPGVGRDAVAGDGQGGAAELVAEALVIDLIEAVFHRDLEAPQELALAGGGAVAERVVRFLGADVGQARSPAPRDAEQEGAHLGIGQDLGLAHGLDDRVRQVQAGAAQVAGQVGAIPAQGRAQEQGHVGEQEAARLRR